MERAGKVPVRVRKEVPGFIINRLTGALEREVDFLLDNGVVTPEDLDAAVELRSRGVLVLASHALIRAEGARKVWGAAVSRIVDGTTTRWGGGLSQYRNTTAATVVPNRIAAIPAPIPRNII